MNIWNLIVSQFAVLASAGVIDLGTVTIASSTVKDNVESTKFYSPTSTLTNPDPAITDDLHRKIRAIINFNCRQGGNMLRAFTWGATYYAATKEIELKGLGHAVLTDLETSGNTFHANVNDEWCVPDVHKTCHYVFRGRTEGSVVHTGIAMSIVGSSTTEGESPTIKEHCESNSGASSSQCPAMPTSATSCRINSINVTLPPWVV